MNTDKTAKPLFLFIAIVFIAWLSHITQSKKEMVEDEFPPVSKSTILVVQQSQDTAKLKQHRFYKEAVTEIEKNDFAERKKFIETLINETATMVRLSENKSADSILKILRNAPLCIADPLGLRFMEQKADSGLVALSLIKQGEKILFPEWKAAINQLHGGILYDSHYNCIVVVQDSVRSKRFKSMLLLAAGNEARYLSILKKPFYRSKGYEFENDVWRGLYGVRYSELIDREADFQKDKAKASGKSIGEYYPKVSRYADELSIYMDEPKSATEANERELRFRIYASLTMIENYGKDKLKEKEKILKHLE